MPGNNLLVIDTAVHSPRVYGWLQGCPRESCANATPARIYDSLLMRTRTTSQNCAQRTHRCNVPHMIHAAVRKARRRGDHQHSVSCDRAAHSRAAQPEVLPNSQLQGKTSSSSSLLGRMQPKGKRHARTICQTDSTSCTGAVRYLDQADPKVLCGLEERSVRRLGNDHLWFCDATARAHVVARGLDCR